MILTLITGKSERAIKTIVPKAIQDLHETHAHGVLSAFTTEKLFFLYHVTTAGYGVVGIRLLGLFFFFYVSFLGLLALRPEPNWSCI